MGVSSQGRTKKRKSKQRERGREGIKVTNYLGKTEVFHRRQGLGKLPNREEKENSGRERCPSPQNTGVQEGGKNRPYLFKRKNRKGKKGNKTIAGEKRSGKGRKNIDAQKRTVFED